MLQDSGARREFVTGAVRDIAEGKGRADLLPLDVVDLILGTRCLSPIENFKYTKDISLITESIKLFVKDHTDYENIYIAIIEASKQFEDGAIKYGENNWKKGIPLHCYIDSGVRHFLKHLGGLTDEPHNRAYIWNMLCAIWTYTHMPEIDDVEKDLISTIKIDPIFPPPTICI